MPLQRAADWAFQSVTTNSIVRKVARFYYREQHDSLYIIPTELLPWFQSGAKYEKIKVDDNKVRVIQKDKSDLHGNYQLVFEFTFDKR